jgi:hypothetical protein
MQVLNKTSARLGIAAAFAAGFAIWRRYKYRPVELRNLDAFESRLARATSEELSRLRADFEALAAFDSNREFRQKRDACRAEVKKRALETEAGRMPLQTQISSPTL